MTDEEVLADKAVGILRGGRVVHRLELAASSATCVLCGTVAGPDSHKSKTELWFFGDRLFGPYDYWCSP